jgi:F-type H+-transporting ATPase subunit gamma
MANRRTLVKRRKAVRNIRKITRTMQLIATARFQAALNRANSTKPYVRKLRELLADLSRASGNVDHPLMRTNLNAPKTALVVITSNRGLCGGYNSNVLRKALAHLDSGGKPVEVTMVGKKGTSYFRFLGRPVGERITDLADSPRPAETNPIINRLIQQFIQGEIAAVHVAYMSFESVSRQAAKVVQLLPLPKPEGLAEGQSSAPVEYEFSPEPEKLLDELLPTSVRAQFFQSFIEAGVSEHIARMVAMKAATDAAGDMIKTLSRQYNRARQTHITMELLDIIGGANALE